MKDFTGKLAVITGGGTGMGRELARQLVAQGCHVAMCDVSAGNMAQTISLCQADAIPQGVRITAHVADVSDEATLQRFRDEIKDQHQTTCIHLLFNNAGIAGGGSMVTDSRAAWERTFNVCWGGVYLGVRTFLDMLIAAPEAHIVNTSSVNGFWATLGPGRPHTAYSAAKFAVKGFTEALIEDLAVNAPHITCSVIMPGHIGTEIAGNSMRIQGREAPDEVIEAANASFRDSAPMSPAAAATVILDAVRAGQWRILVGEDAKFLDQSVRADPESAYTPGFVRKLKDAGHFALL